MAKRASSFRLSDLLELYEIYSKDNRVYNGIVWQFPLALVTVNAVSIAFLWERPLLLPVLPIINFALLHALFKLGHNQSAIIDTLQQIESELRGRSARSASYVPDFEKNRGEILGWRSRMIISWTLLIMNIAFLLVALMAAAMQIVKLAIEALH